MIMTGLTITDFQEAAKELNIDVPVIMAVADVESAGDGFLKDGRPKILFEAQWFSKFTNGKFNLSHPNISSPKWDRTLYKGGAREYTRLEEAKKLDLIAALMSTSWGMFQIMGFNFELCGFDNVIDFVKSNYNGVKSQLMSFVSYLKKRNIHTFLLARDWAKFAKFYNGPGYKVNHYDEKLKKAYFKYLESYNNE